MRNTIQRLACAAAVALLVLAVAEPSQAGRRLKGRSGRLSVQAPQRVNTIDLERRIDINNLNMFVANNGAFGYDLSGNYSGGLFFPNHTSKTAVYAAGLWVGALIGGEIHLAVAEYDQEYRPGRILGGGTSADPPGDPRLVVYKVMAWKGVPDDTAHVDNPNYDPDRGEDPLVHHSWSEYMNGAVPFGAPTRNWTISRPSLPDTTILGPDVLGDQMLWSVYNDLDPDAHTNEAGSTDPLGIQVEQQTFAFDRKGALGNTIFVRYKITASQALNNVYISQWADADLGGFTDDLVGADTLLDAHNLKRSLGFIYNGSNEDEVYGTVPPALGIDFLKGPTVAGNPLPLTSFAKYINGTDPFSPEETYNYMQGLNSDGTPIVDPFGNTTKFMVSGDLFGPPAINWVDNNPSDRRFFLTSGPFDMAAGETQEVVVAIVVGQCGDRLRSIRAMQFADDVAQETYDLNYVIPIPPPTPIVTATADHGEVRIQWDTAAINADLEPGYKFEGWNVYQGATIAGPWRLVAVYDSVNTVRQLFDTKFSDADCEPVRLGTVAYGQDNGLRDFHVTDQDILRGTNLKDGTDYYFAVSSYATNPLATANLVLESSLKVVTATPQRLASAVTASDVKPVPNPYYAHSTFETSQFSRRIKFLNCPAQCTIRIYNLAGQLVRTLEKNDPNTSVIEWDTETRNGLPVGSGVYIFRVDAAGGTESVGRIVVFMEKERLNNF